LPPAIWRELPALEILKLDGSTVPGVPREVLTDRSGKGCLIAIRAHFADLETEQANITDVKLLLLGNGGVGKTQIARWLAGATFDPNWDSTHGIQILPEASQDSIAAKLHLQIWDFGGQDIYHGTHALFLRNPAIVMAVWADGKENADVYELGGITFRNYPLAYWIDVVRQQAAPQSPVLITQSQCDRWEQESRSPPASTEALKALPIWQPLWVSAKERRGKHALEEALSNAVTWLRDPKRLGTPQIGAARLRVQRRLEALRNADLERPPQQREHRLLDRGMFDTICAEEGGVASTALLLEYLNANGTVIYRSGLFNGQIVLDQAWALDAIYAVFERKRVYKELSRLGGRFTRPLLELLVWQDKSEEEQQLLLGMMRSCGMCFVYRDGSAGENEYIAPDLLPEKPAVARDLALLWRDDLPEETAVFRYSLLHGGMIRGVIVAIGERAWNKALYWRGGLCAYDARTRSRMLVEAEMTGQWQGAIRLRAQGGQASILLQWLIDIIERQNDKLGVRPIAVERSSPARDMAPQVQPDFRHDSRDKREWYVSYAWGDTTPEGQQRAKAVDDACKAAVERGWVIRRDKDEMSFGDDIKQFMDRIGAADRILVIMSAKYFMSFYCVYELTEIWRNCRRDADSFVKRVRLFALPDADFWEPEDRVSLASHWLERHQRLIEMTRLGAIGGGDAQKMIEMKRFSLDLPEILEALANRVQPRSFPDVVRYAFEDGK
jgi:internalin A